MQMTRVACETVEPATVANKLRAMGCYNIITCLFVRSVLRDLALLNNPLNPFPCSLTARFSSCDDKSAYIRNAQNIKSFVIHAGYTWNGKVTELIVSISYDTLVM